MSTRALTHEKGTAQEIRISIEAIPDSDILTVPALDPVQQFPECLEDSQALIRRLLHDAGVQCVDTVLELTYSLKGLRGAALIDNLTGERLDTDIARGVRASTFDAKVHPTTDCAKNHFLEALVLASKVQSAPGVIAEVCLSDDPNYTKGYVACCGKFHRIPHIKPEDSDLGTRIFVLESGADVAACIEYLENTPVLIDLAGTEFDAAASEHQSSAPGFESSPHSTASGNHPKSPPPLPDAGGDAERPSGASLSDVCARRNEAWAAQGLARELKVFNSAQLPRSVVDGQEYLLFASSDYLGLSTNPRVVRAAQEATARYGTGSGGSRLTTGTSLHSQLERELAQFFGTEDAVFFTTGYQANHSTIAALATSDVEVFSDSLNHASIIDGCRSAKAKVTVFPHGDYAALDRLLAASTAPHALVISDAVFSMSGEVVDLPALSRTCHRYGAWLMLDDAHGIGVTGPSGRGTFAHYQAQAVFGAEPQHISSANEQFTKAELFAPDIIVGTASKALGAEGGFVLCSSEVATLLRNQARSYVYSASSAPAIVAAVRESLKVLAETDVVEQLQARIAESRVALGLSAAEPGVGLNPVAADNLVASSNNSAVLESGGMVQAPVGTIDTQAPESTRNTQSAGSAAVIQRPVSAIIPITIGDERHAMEVSAQLREEGIFVPAIRYPTVKRGEAMLRLTVTANHSSDDVALLAQALRKLDVIR